MWVARVTILDVQNRLLTGGIDQSVSWLMMRDVHRSELVFFGGHLTRGEGLGKYLKHGCTALLSEKEQF